MLNVFAVEGFLTDDVVLTFEDGKKTYKAAFHLRNPKKIGKKIFNNEFYVLVYGKKAEHCKRSLSAGMKVSVSGSLLTWFTRDENGNKQTGVTINATDVDWGNEG